MKRIANYLLTATALLGAAALLTFAAKNDFGLARNMETLVNMMRELSLNYVDPVDPDRLMEGAAAGMVSGAMANPMSMTYANEITPGDDAPVAYATTYPLSMFARVVIAQLLVLCFV